MAISIISKTISDAIDVPLNMTNAIPCDNYTTDNERSCMDQQLHKAKRDHKRIGWHDLQPGKMCASCAAHWHLSCARNFALGVMR